MTMAWGAPSPASSELKLARLTYALECWEGQALANPRMRLRDYSNSHLYLPTCWDMTKDGSYQLAFLAVTPLGLSVMKISISSSQDWPPTLGESIVWTFLTRAR